MVLSCPFCGYDFIKSNIKNQNTRKIQKNGLSFECPDYYDVGDFHSEDEAHKSIVALSKNDRTCELYIMEYKDYAFDNNAKKDYSLLKRYLKMQGYENILQNKNLPYCFNAKVNSQLGKIRTTILFNFDNENVIMIVGNISPGSNYECVNDIKIINDTILTENQIKTKFFEGLYDR